MKMENFDDGDDFFSDDDSMEDSSYDDFGPEDYLDNDIGIEDAPTGDDDMCDYEFTVEDSVMTGIAFGWGYEEGKRRKLEKKMQDDQDQLDNHS
jgi:hypothetical protein